ncbi:MAG: helix-turn-helix domain-containing protein [Candidatus Woesearchaeota archaeon]
MPITRITVIKTSRPSQAGLNEKLLWLGGSLGLFNQRDKDKSCFRVFITLVKEKEGVTSDQIADQLKLTRGTAVHHLNKLMESGIVIRERNIYHLRGDSVQDVIAHVERTMNKALEDLKQTAEEIDKSMRR